MSHVVLNDVAKPSLTVLFLHGLGGSGMGWEQMVKPITPFFPSVKFILPSAPKMKVTFSGETIPSWYDIAGFSTDHVEDEAGIKRSVKQIHDIIEAEEKNHGTPSNKLLLAGASQGGAIALYAGLTYKKPLAGILALSTYLPLHTHFPKVLTDENKNIPLLMCHGEQDSIVKFEWAQKSYDILKSCHNNVEFKTYKEMGHSSCPAEIMDILGFLGKVVQQAQSS